MILELKLQKNLFGLKKLKTILKTRVADKGRQIKLEQKDND